MGLKLNGATDGSIELDVPAAIGSDISFTLPGADGTAGQFLKTDGSNSLSFTNELPNNYALIRYVENGTQVSQTGLGTTDVADAYISVTTNGYKRGDIVVAVAYVPAGIALTSTDANNYCGVEIKPRLTNGSTTLQGESTKVWFRDDGRATKETMQMGVAYSVIQPDSTTFNDGDNLTFTCVYKKFGEVGLASVGICNWAGRRSFQLFHYRKEI